MNVSWHIQRITERLEAAHRAATVALEAMEEVTQGWQDLQEECDLESLDSSLLPVPTGSYRNERS